MIMRTGPFYDKRPIIGEIWRKGMLSFKILDLCFFNGKELVITECCDAAFDKDLIGRRTFESVFAFKKPFWKKTTNEGISV